MSRQSNKLYSRGGKNGEGFTGVKDILDLFTKSHGAHHGSQYYTKEQQAILLRTAEDIQKRMRVKLSTSYLQHASNVPINAKHMNPILKVVMPSTDEVQDMSGENDPSHQNRFSFIPGLLHKYEMLLVYASINCSSHCRYCYRLDLFTGISSKEKANIAQVASYIRVFNDLIDKAFHK